MAGSPTFTRASQSLIHQVSDSDKEIISPAERDWVKSQSLIHQVSVSDQRINHGINRGNNVSIPYSSGLRFRCRCEPVRRKNRRAVSIPYSSGLRFRLKMWGTPILIRMSLNPLFIRSQIQMQTCVGMIHKFVPPASQSLIHQVSDSDVMIYEVNHIEG